MGERLSGLEEQMSLLAPSCKARACERPVVGSSITGDGHVCRGHNELEWGRALRSYAAPLSAALIAASERSLA